MVRRRFWAEVVLAAIGAVLGVVTVLVPDWIERLGGEGGDAGGGGTERLVAIGFLVAATVLAVRARVEWRRPMEPAFTCDGSTGEGS
ncbi:MAG: hypothetical protein ABIU87_01525 [Ornithinibacter sp.]